MDVTGFNVIYPSYLDSTKSMKQGRRLSREESVATPTVTDMSYALQKLNIRHAVQPYKGYSRDISCQWDNPGRILVDIPQTMMVPDNSTTQNPKKLVMKEIASIIPSLQYRMERLAKEEEETKKKEEEKKKQQAVAAAASKTTTSKISVAASSNKKKKGKKKR